MTNFRLKKCIPYNGWLTEKGCKFRWEKAREKVKPTKRLQFTNLDYCKKCIGVFVEDEIEIKRED